MMGDGRTLVALSRVHFPVTALGYGRRTGIWLQGCSIGCRGCIVPESWLANPDHELELSCLLEAIKPWLGESDGVTISGGEPFDQSPALAALLVELRRWCSGDLLVYSGYTVRHLRRVHEHILCLADAFITGPFVAGLEDERSFVGSSNQEIVCMTDLGRERYANVQNYPRRRDVAVVHGAVLMAGVAQRGELRALTQALSASGYEAKATHDAV